jgi:hypothetical protein
MSINISAFLHLPERRKAGNSEIDLEIKGYGGQPLAKVLNGKSQHNLKLYQTETVPNKHLIHSKISQMGLDF